MLTLLIAAFPESLTRVELAGQAGYSNAKSGGFAAPLARLVELGICGNCTTWSRSGKRDALPQREGQREVKKIRIGVQRALHCRCGRGKVLALGMCATCYTLKRQDEEYFGGLREQVLATRRLLPPGLRSLRTRETLDRSSSSDAGRLEDGSDDLTLPRLPRDREPNQSHAPTHAAFASGALARTAPEWP